MLRASARQQQSDISHMAYFQDGPGASNVSIPSSRESINDFRGGRRSSRAPSARRQAMILPEAAGFALPGGRCMAGPGIHRQPDADCRRGGFPDCIGPGQQPPGDGRRCRAELHGPSCGHRPRNDYFGLPPGDRVRHRCPTEWIPIPHPDPPVKTAFAEDIHSAVTLNNRG